MDWFVQAQRLLPQKLITLSAGCLANNRWPPLKNFLINQFIKLYDVDMSEAEALSSSQYSNFNDFFTRSLRPNARTIFDEENTIICPADGAISEFGSIESGQLLQAKGMNYSVGSLLADKNQETVFNNGSFATVYLSPKDYHRVHMPLSGNPTKVTYIPGKLFSVNQRTAENLEGLFALNERLVIEFENEGNPFAVVLVGAMIVGGISTVLTGKIKRTDRVEQLHFDKLNLNKGDELGRFHLGSTAIMLFPKNTNLEFDNSLKVGSTVKMGQKIAAAT